MSCLKEVPTLRGDNDTEWRKKVELAFVCADLDWVLDEPQPVRPTEPVREATDDDAAWSKKRGGLCSFGDVIHHRKPKVGQCKQKVHGIYKEYN